MFFFAFTKVNMKFHGKERFRVIFGVYIQAISEEILRVVSISLVCYPYYQQSAISENPHFILRHCLAMPVAMLPLANLPLAKLPVTSNHGLPLGGTHLCLMVNVLHVGDKNS